ncbi:MAG: type IV pilus assembly protein PilM [Syntrophomonadaceae bacterium]|nr:type IV pilus assembly protein PilM [Syntrophomonadaceae bacterium]
MSKKAAPGIGLDIGSRKVKIVQLKKTRNGYSLVNFGSIKTPPGAVDSGYIHDPERLGECLGELIVDLKLKNKAVVSAVSGPQVYTRTLVMPRMKPAEQRVAVRYEATTFLPIPVDEAAIDISPLTFFEDEEGKKVDLFFVAVRKQQVENLSETCRIAGIKLAAVEIEPLALHRLLKDDGLGVQAFVNIGATRSTFSVFNGEALKFYRHLSFGSSPFLLGPSMDMEGGVAGLEKVVLGSSEEHQFLLRDIISELSRSIEYYNMQNENEINKLMLCGGAASINGLDAVLAEGINISVINADTLDRIELPTDTSEAVRQEMGNDYAVALGLAAREVI